MSRAAGVVTAEPPAEIAPVPPTALHAQKRQSRLLRMGPFAIGFFFTLGAMLAYGLTMAMWSLKDVIVIVVASLFIALGLNRLVDWLQRRGLKRGISLAIVALGVIVVLAVGSSVLVPLLVTQSVNVWNNAPQYLQRLRENEQFADLDRRYKIIEQITKFLTSEGAATNMFGGLLGTGKVIANVVTYTTMLVFLTASFLFTMPQIKNAIYELAPKSRRPRAKYLVDEMFRRIGGYLMGMFVVATIAATCAFMMMMFVGLGQYALALAFVVAMFAFVPLVGSLISMVIIAIMALSVSPTAALIVIIYFLAYSQVDAYVLQPRIMSRQVSVPGATVILGAIAGGTLFGVVGALIAVPTVAALLLLYREVLLPQLENS